MKGRIAVGLMALCLVAPVSASATGTPNQPPPKQECGACCRDLGNQFTNLTQVFNTYQTSNDQRVTVLEQQLRVTNQRLEQLENWVTAINVNVNTVINQVQTLSCQSDRVYDFRVRTEVDGSPVTGITRVEVMGRPVTESLQDKDRGGWHRNGGGRLVVRATYAGVTAPNGQVRTVVVFVRTEDGRTHRLAQKLRLCLEDDGNMNDRSAQGRADD